MGCWNRKKLSELEHEYDGKVTDKFKMLNKLRVEKENVGKEIKEK